MNEILTLLKQFFAKFQLWIIVVPWQQAVRVRFGTQTKLLGSGIHLRIPFVDQFYVQTTRMRTCGLGRQTVTNTDQQTITFAASVGYAIGDVLRLYQTLHHAEDYIASTARAAIAQYISTHSAAECEPLRIQEAVSSSLDLEQFGLTDAALFLSDFAVVRTYRIIGDWGSGGGGAPLDTDRTTTAQQNGVPIS